ncbi:MAG TPA: D-alanyl-D-alanine carboxypeptidase family protein [Dissulfurispiraceae bacterium]|nr:D-alanyl-D-alanine carboxypeptidase family protein [Dissulfurispiraceae bacterium]
MLKKIYGVLISAALILLVACPGVLPARDASAEEVAATAAIVMDASSERILYAKNPNLKLRPASTTKLVTAMVALDHLHPDAMVRISVQAAETPSVSPRLRAGEQFSVRSLLTLSLMRSVNSAAVALAEATTGSEDAFAELMNRKAADIGADNARFINASGLPGPDQYVTAFDLAKIMKESLKYPVVLDIINTKTESVYSSKGRKLVIKNTNELLWNDSDVLGGKTGYTREARHCFVGAAQKGQNVLISAVLGEVQRGNLWNDTEKLIARGNEVMNRRAEPMITYSSQSDSPIVFAAYRSDGSAKPGKKATFAKSKKKSTGVEAKKPKKTKKSVNSEKKVKKKPAPNTTAEGKIPAGRS